MEDLLRRIAEQVNQEFEQLSSGQMSLEQFVPWAVEASKRELARHSYWERESLKRLIVARLVPLKDVLGEDPRRYDDDKINALTMMEIVREIGFVRNGPGGWGAQSSQS